MPLSSEFVHRDLILKHGHKGKPGYELLHPGTHMPRTYRTPHQEATLQRIGALMQNRDKAGAKNLLDKIANMTPSDRKYVGSKISAMRVSGNTRAIHADTKSVEGKDTPLAHADGVPDAPVMALVVPKAPKKAGGRPKKVWTPPGMKPLVQAGGEEQQKVDLTPLDVAPVLTDHTDDGPDIPLDGFVEHKTVEGWYTQIQQAQNADALDALEGEILSGLASQGQVDSPLHDDLLDQINARHRALFEATRHSDPSKVQKWLKQRGLVTKHGHKGAPGYELLHPNSMMRGKRSDKQNSRLERFGALLQAGKHEEAQALLDRSLNVTPEDRKHIEGQIKAARGGKDGGKPASDPHPHASAGGNSPAQDKPAPKDAPAPKAAEKPAQGPTPGPKNEPYSPDAQDNPNASVDVSAMTKQEQSGYEDQIIEALQQSNHAALVDDLGVMVKGDNIPPDMQKRVVTYFKWQRDMLSARGGVNSFGEETAYEHPSPATIHDSQRKLLLSPKKMGTKDLTAAMVRDERPPDSTPAGKHLLAGGSIGDSPSDGLLQAIEANPKRFTMENNNSDSVSETFTVTDHAHKDEQHFFKRALNGEEVLAPDGSTFNPEIVGDGANEVTAAALGRSVFPGMFPSTSYGENPAVPHPMIRQEHLAAFVPGASKTNYDQGGMYDLNADDNSATLKKGVPPVADRSQIVAMHVFDYLIANADRHFGNVASAEVGGKRHLIAIDHGGANHAFIGEHRDDNKFAPDQMHPSLMQPETVPYDTWQTEMVFSPGRKMNSRILRAEAVAAYGGDLKSLRADAQKVIDKYRAVDTKKILADLLALYPNLDPYERAHMEAMVKVWQGRIQMVNADDVAKVLS